MVSIVSTWYLFCVVTYCCLYHKAISYWLPNITIMHNEYLTYVQIYDRYIDNILDIIYHTTLCFTNIFTPHVDTFASFQISHNDYCILHH